MQQKGEKGLCFHCDERFSPGHRCKHKVLKVLWVTEDEVEDEEDLPSPKPTMGEEPLAEGPISAVLCVSSLVGLCSPHSMKVRGKINGREVIVLIDPGASHNFVVESLMTELQLNCDPTHEFGVQMGNGDEIRASGVCHGLHLQFAETNVVADFFPLKLGALYVVLGF